MECTDCGCEMIVTDSGRYKRFTWTEWTCTSCGNVTTDEPDYDSEPGGHDDY